VARGARLASSIREARITFIGGGTRGHNARSADHRPAAADRGARIDAQLLRSTVRGSYAISRMPGANVPRRTARGARYVWQGERAAGRRMLHWEKIQKKARTAAGLIGSG